MLNLAANLPKVNHLGHSGMEVLFRTCVRDKIEGPLEPRTLRTEILIAGFKHYIKFHLVEYAAQLPDRVITAFPDSPLLPTPEEVNTSRPRFIELSQTSASLTDWDQEVIMPMALFRDSMFNFFDGRSAFMTSMSQFGLGPGGMEVGDQVWFLKGGKVPFILRPLQNGNFELIGEAFFYGFMRGEIFDFGGKSVDDAVTITIE